MKKTRESRKGWSRRNR